MNSQADSTLTDNASLGQINGHAADPEFNSSQSADSPAMFQYSSSESANYLRIRNQASRGRDLGTENGRNNEFVTVFSHELRNSLGVIRSAAHILCLDTSADPSTVKVRFLIERQVGQMMRLVDDLLDASRFRSAQLRLHCERIDLRVLAAHAVQDVEFTMQQRRHQMTTSFPDAPVWLQADPARLEQVFVNLLLNAAKYTDAGGNIGLIVDRQADEAIVRIRDSGIGIGPDVLPHVFDLFVQEDPSSRRVDAGLGIGLALVRSLVERHGGRVTVTSAGPGRGSEFTVRLPRPVD
jgi:signal transduction histidine kinase